ncbi:hypothetical protein NAT51_03685 [Flavobacterium amniphilum]|uniref:hypothetical protein n=1 Tax=Flavobacterium amniphilum TaxID=1834035 RepID=UPI002029F282|nr:hypothetical protein [Flavobacterium amniphilum]MCL9804608.1 hypothetical protein [Flavobacterium amniphilum]
MKKNKKERLQFEKFSVMELNNLIAIKGGGNDAPPTVTHDLTITGGSSNGGGGSSSADCTK